MLRTIDQRQDGEQRNERDGDHRHHDGGLDAIALPDNGDIAGAVGHPDNAEGQHGDQRKEEKNTDHRGAVLKVPS